MEQTALIQVLNLDMPKLTITQLILQRLSFNILRLVEISDRLFKQQPDIIVLA